MRILLVEDDTLIGDGIKAGLGKWVSASTGLPGTSGQGALYSAPYDTVYFRFGCCQAWTDGIFCANGAKRVNRNRY